MGTTMRVITGRSAWVGTLLTCLAPSAAVACRYSVRDVGFVDPGGPAYRFCLIVRNDTPKEWIKAFEQASCAALLDSNVEFRLVNLDQQNDGEATKYLKGLGIRSIPAAVLISPRGQALQLPLSASGGPDDKAALACLESSVISPLRASLLKVAAEAYCVILLIDGDSSEENRRAEQAVNGSIEEIAGMMGQLPKAIKNPPRLLRLPAQSRAQERVLLWSLGLDRPAPAQPCAVVVYGRGRWIGPCFEGPRITSASLRELISLVGADCECGLDRRQMLGVMLPMQWDDELRSEIAKNLGFDPENPAVKTEVSQILAMGARTQGNGRDPLEPGLLGYTEQVVEFEGERGQVPSTLRLPTVPDQPIAQRSPDKPTAKGPVPMSSFGADGGVRGQVPSTMRHQEGQDELAGQRSPETAAAKGPVPVSFPGRGAWLVAGALAVIIIAGSVFVILRAQRRPA
jgi:hypothetical protein